MQSASLCTGTPMTTSVAEAALAAIMFFRT
jgi:hypothetical protein